MVEFPRFGPHRLAAQDAALSRPKQGFESPWGHSKNRRKPRRFFLLWRTSIIIAVFVWDQVGAQSCFELLGLLQGDQVIQFKPVELANSVSKIVHKIHHPIELILASVPVRKPRSNCELVENFTRYPSSVICTDWRRSSGWR